MFSLIRLIPLCFAWIVLPIWFCLKRSKTASLNLIFLFSLFFPCSWVREGDRESMELALVIEKWDLWRFHFSSLSGIQSLWPIMIDGPTRTSFSSRRRNHEGISTFRNRKSWDGEFRKFSMKKQGYISRTRRLSLFTARSLLLRFPSAYLHKRGERETLI